MRIIEFAIEPSWTSTSHTDYIEVKDEATDEEIEAAVTDEVNNVCSYGWTEIPI